MAGGKRIELPPPARFFLTYREPKKKTRRNEENTPLIQSPVHLLCRAFFFNDTATTEIYTLSLHDALPIWIRSGECAARGLLRGLLDPKGPRFFSGFSVSD